MAAYTFKGHDVEVLKIEGNLALISEKGVEFSVRVKQLKEKKEPRVSRGAKRAQLEAEGKLPNYKNSERYKGADFWQPKDGAVEHWTPYFLTYARLRITSSEANKTAKELSELLGISTGQAEAFIEPCSETTHGAKFDIVVTDSKELASAPDDLQLYFNSEGHSCRSPLEVQIGCREFAEHLMKSGLVPIGLHIV